MKDDKKVRLKTSDGRVLCNIYDGESVLLCRKDGTNTEIPCKYLDDNTLMFGTKIYSAADLANKLSEEGAHCEPFPEKKMIWSNRDLDLKDWIDDLKENYPDLDEDGLTTKMYEIIGDYLDDERVNLNIRCGDDIIVIADIGRWNGRFQGYKLIESGNIRDCLYSAQDYCEWYVDREGEFRCTEIHHDGQNNLYYRKFREDASYDDRDELLADIYEGKATQEQIDRLTEKLGPQIAEVYGWKLPTEKEPVRVDREVR